MRSAIDWSNFEQNQAAKYARNVWWPRADFEWDRAAKYESKAVQRRVADAQAAGLHPLFALGAVTGSSPAIQAGGLAGSGPARFGGSSGAGMAAQRAFSDALLQSERSKTALNIAEADRAAAEAARARQEANYVRNRTGPRGLGKDSELRWEPTERELAEESRTLSAERQAMMRPAGIEGRVKTALGDVYIPKGLTWGEFWEMVAGEPGEVIGGLDALGQIVEHTVRKQWKADVKRARQAMKRWFQ